ncbi:acyltransferase [Flammeovirga kamogawensis]|nr:DapH/DapD/GlmU-related protein [Flammeovirga kamogawensis]MBB6460751.1 acetyltransferase-like isoleucine patch superfamily enzyme [Flammeovirga kamogawensis]
MEIHDSSNISLTVSSGCYFAASKRSKLVIKKNVIIAPNVLINTENHGLKDRRIYNGKIIIINSNVWIGANSLILSGAEIGENCTIAGGSVVLRGAYRGNTLLAGNPAVIKKEIV